jgi:DNA-binding transcriptional LysR family regulator
MEEVQKKFRQHRWLLLDRRSNTGAQLQRWLAEQGATVEPAMELDSFDMILNLVSLGLGVSLVPHRVLPLYMQRRISIKNVFERQLGVIVRKNRSLSQPLASFAESILF